MVRWSDGLFGGLIAGVTSAFFYAVVAVAWLHETTLGAFFAQIAQALPPFHHAPEAPLLVALGVVLHLLVAGAFGILYTSLAANLRSMQRAPTSVLWGLCYGLVVWFVLNDVVVPLTEADNIQPLWEGLLGTMVFYGVVLSEYTTVVVRREATPAP
ncbi:MAG TPA: hypothetical protein VE591_09540 [Candidatus Acidoferrum sp.]|nr:hypothetical protein [Candidatus Acidoferrum sp.]